MRLIDADALPNIYTATHQELILALEDAPTIEPKKGEWIVKREETQFKRVFSMHLYNCSECGHEILITTNYCPNCGADMRGEQNG